MSQGAPVGATLRHFLWLQGRLLRNGLMRGDARSRGRLLLTGMLLLSVIPTVTIGTIGLYFALRTMGADTAQRVLSVAMGALLLMWALAPLTGQPLTESVGYLRLLHHPVRPLSFLFGGQVSALLSLLGLISLPILTSSAVALADGPVSLLAAMLSLAAFVWLCVSVKCLATLLTDLLSEDRRLRNLTSFLLMLAFMALYLDQVGIGHMDSLEGGPGFFRQGAWSTVLAGWLPSGWTARALLASADGRYGAWLLGTSAVAGLALALIPLQALLLRRLLWGDLPHATAEGHAASDGLRRDGGRLPGLGMADSRRLKALLRKDWLVQKRSPMTLRLSILPLLFGFMAWQAGRADDLDGLPAVLLPVAIGAMAGFVSGSLGNNRLGMVDHIGTGTLLASPAPRRLILLAHGLSQLLLTGILAGACGVGLLLGRGVWADLGPLLIAAAATGGVVTGLGLISSVRFPTYVDLERGRAETNQASFAGVLLLLLGVPLLMSPLVGGFAVAAIFRPALLPWLLPVALVYGLGFFLLGLNVANRLLPGQESRLLEVLVDGR